MKRKKKVLAGIRTRNLLLRRQAPYPLGHEDKTLCPGGDSNSGFLGHNEGY